MHYIKVAKVYEKLKNAEKLYSPVIMTAESGYGKSMSVQYYYRRKNPLVLRCENGKLEQMPAICSIRANIVIIEDMQWLIEEESMWYLKELLYTSNRQIVMLTRGAVPEFLTSIDMDLGFVHIQEKDFTLGEEQVKEFFYEKGIEIHSDDIVLVTKASRGYIRALYCYATRMENGARYSEEMKEAVWQDMFHLWDGYFYKKLPESFVRFGLSMCCFDKFTKEMAEYITGNENIPQIIEYCRRTMSQLQYHSKGYYSIRLEARKYYIWKQQLLWSRNAISENYKKAAEFYEKKDDIPNALCYYKKAGDMWKVKDLLIQNAGKHPGKGCFVEIKEYYFDIEKKQIVESPVLMSTMSMLYSLILRQDKSEEWYKELQKFEKDRKNSREKRREARIRLAYLDIILPHRGTKRMIHIMRNVFSLIKKGDIILPELSVTGNLPSVMNGGLDFCEWSKNDKQIAKFMAKIVEVITGKFGNGLVTIALAESGFEKGTMSAYEVLTRCNDGFEVALHSGKIEMCFASVGIQVRQYIVKGQLQSAKRICKSFHEKAMLENANQLVPNMEAFEVWLSLFDNTGDKVRLYIDSVPDAKISFSILDRYRQLIKVRCLIAENRLEEAFDLSCFLTGYFSSYERHFYWMENEVLKSIILYRMKDKHWIECFLSALEKADEYHFVRLISIEGVAVLPLLNEIYGRDTFQGISVEFMRNVFRETEKIALFYPDYLRFIPQIAISFTKREEQVLSMLCTGMTMEEICLKLKITYSGLKKHNRNIYKKLDVKGRAEAERRATQLGLVHRRKLFDIWNSKELKVGG